MKKLFLLFFLAWTMMFCTKQVSADIRLIRDIDFGTIAILDNSSPENVTIDQVGNYSTSTNILIIEQGEHGIVELFDYLPGSEIDLTATIVQASSSTPVVSLEKFTLSDTFIQNTVVIGTTGSEQVRLGGRIITSGNGSLVYAETEYTHRIQITVSF